MEPEPGARCVGQCCQMFALDFSPVEIAKRYEEFLAHPETKRTDDIHLIAPMVRYLGVGPSQERDPVTGEVSYEPRVVQLRGVRRALGHVPGEGEDVSAEGVALTFYYTCVHLQPNGDCGIYAIRPRMCSGFPYAERCPYADCQCAPARAGELGTPLAELGAYGEMARARAAQVFGDQEEANAWR